MPYISSPVAYPLTSSPTAEDVPRKKRKVEESEPRSPLKAVEANSRHGPFIENDEEDDIPELKRKLPQLHSGLREVTRTTSAPWEPAVETRNEERLVSSEFRIPPSVDIVDHEHDKSAKTVHPGGLLRAQTCGGKSIYIGERRRAEVVPYERLVAAQPTAIEGRARKSYYGIDIHKLMDETAVAEKERLENAAAAESVRTSIENRQSTNTTKKGRNLMWTEKYRARKFTDLIGDERTHRSVLRWLKNWDPIVFPGSSKPKTKPSKFNNTVNEETKAHRKILLLAGPPGLGKTTLAHVCAQQAGYEVQEINASDERSGNVVKGRIRDMVGTENVRGTEAKTANGTVRKAGRPVCVVIDEVDGVVTGSGGSGEGGFIKALIELVLLDQKNSNGKSSDVQAATSKKWRKKENFRVLRPLILICNDVYHPSLRPLRQSSIAEIIHVRKPPLNMVVSRVHSIFEREGIPADVDGVRRICEATWGMSTRKEGGNGVGTTEGDIRSVIVLGEWTAAKLHATTPVGSNTCQRLTRRWVEDNLLGDLAPGGGAARSLGRGGAREVVDRVFQEGAGFPKTVRARSAPILKDAAKAEGIIGVAEAAKRRAIEQLREMIDTSGETERIVTDCFTSYPNQPIQDDTYLTKPNSAYEWLHFHDQLHSQLTSSQDWELAPYLSTPALAFHHLFAHTSTARHQHSSTHAKNESDDAVHDAAALFAGPGAPYAASEAQRATAAALAALHASLALPLARLYRAPADLAAELVPFALRILSPDVRPVLVHSQSAAAAVGGAKAVPTASVRKASERALVARAVQAMAATGVRFERVRVEFDGGVAAARGVAGWVYRMEPALDVLGVYETMGKGGVSGEAVRYAVRQVLDSEWKKEEVRRGEATRRRRMGGSLEEEVEQVDAKDAKHGEAAVKRKTAKRDFFGRVIEDAAGSKDTANNGATKNTKQQKSSTSDEGRVWVSFHEGFSNAVRKPITFEELMRGL